MLHHPAEQFQPDPSGKAVPTACPVEDLGRRFQKAVEHLYVFDGSPEAKHAEMLISALSEASVLTQTKSPMGALFQLTQIVGSVEVILDLLNFGEHDQEIRHHAMRFDVGAWSIRRFIEDHFQIDAREAGADYSMPARTSFEGSIERWVSELQQAAE